MDRSYIVCNEYQTPRLFGGFFGGISLAWYPFSITCMLEVKFDYNINEIIVKWTNNTYRVHIVRIHYTHQNARTKIQLENVLSH